ncbi:MAG: hypothetical protein K2W86_01805 [Sphingomonas sp.]|uniref:cupin domain-containing protein n=1 Tax=Sphingomonas sp. TaxID=28214 RepID=UPI0035A852E8|nr:hypothetical protein [Sphingomonas sp.]
MIGDGLAAEIFVLSGSVTVSDTMVGLHGYIYLHEPQVVHSASGAVLLVFLDPRAAQDDPAIIIDTIHQPWDRSGLEGEIAHLNYARKNLRFSPDGDRRTYLLGGMPHGHPQDGSRLERHPHAEEMFLIAGDMPCSLGVMTAGAYFYRPPDIWHGLDCTVAGFLIIMRTPGSNATISQWTEDAQPVLIDPPYQPELPPGHVSFNASSRRPMVDY